MGMASQGTTYSKQENVQSPRQTEHSPVTARSDADITDLARCAQDSIDEQNRRAEALSRLTPRVSLAEMKPVPSQMFLTVPKGTPVEMKIDVGPGILDYLKTFDQRFLAAESCASIAHDPPLKPPSDQEP